jgi:hypothetical protein
MGTCSFLWLKRAFLLFSALFAPLSPYPPPLFPLFFGIIPYLILRVAGLDFASGPIPVNIPHCSPYNTHADLSDSTLAAEVAAEGGEKGGIFFNEANLPTTPT